MKKRYLIGGIIEIEHQTFASLLKDILDSSKVRDRYASDIEKVIHYNSDDLDIYIYEDGEKDFLFDAELKGTIEDTQNFISTLTEKLRDLNCNHQFEWNEVDENNNQVGEEYEIRFPSNE